MLIDLQRERSRAAIALLVLLVGLAIGSDNLRAEGDVYQVGVAKVDITPDYPIRLNGFGGRREESEGTTQPIWAKAIAVGADSDRPVILVTLDSLGIRQTMVDEIARRLKEKAGIERDRVIVTFSHSHTTPKVNGACDTIFSTPIPPEHQLHIDRYTKELTDAIEAVALNTLASRSPALLSWGVGQVGFAKNRRTPGGPVDHDLPMLVIKSEDGSIRAILVTYACHCVTLSDNKISGDWAGFAQRAIEANHPGAIALTSIGCGSDSNPDSGVTGDKVAAAAEQGGQIAAEVERLLGGPLKPLSGPVTTTLNKIDLPLKPLPTREQLEATAAAGGPAGYNATFQLEKIKRGEPLQTSLDYPVQTLTFGDSLAMVFLGGEVCVDYSSRLKKELDSKRVWLHGYANDFCAYIPSERLLKEGGYGGGAETVYFALPNTLAQGLEEKIIAEVHRQLPADYLRTPESNDVGNSRSTTVEEALAKFQIAEGYVIEAVAAEPLVADPVAIDFGPDGRLWVAEMPDYTRYADEEFEPHGSVRALVDRDGDGRYDAATTYADGLRFPTDVKAWKKGVIVCDAPDVIFFEDTDGDGRADKRTTLLSGFATHNAQARVNSLRWGLDNWLYGACGLFGGTITTSSGKVAELGERDFRFRPGSGELEPVAGRTQQGRARDEWGNWFGCENGSLVDHYPLIERYVSRNPLAPPPPAEIALVWGEANRKLYPIGTPSIFALSGSPGFPTSACGLEIYRDDLLGKDFSNNAFVAEPVNQLVHRRILTPRGTTFSAVRAKSETRAEFLASTDPWFRPVQVRTGNDGCLYVVDMHRAVIEHPKFIPAEVLQKADPMAGQAEGRIYRIRPEVVAPRSVPRLDQLTPAELAAQLESPNGPLRDLAQQILVETKCLEVTPQLEHLVRESPRSATRLQALCTLDGLKSLSSEIVLAALADKDARVQRHAVRVAEPRLAAEPAMLDAVEALASHTDSQVRLQVAYSLGAVAGDVAADALAEIAIHASNDPYLLNAVWTTLRRDNVCQIAERVLGQIPADAPASALTEPLISTMFAIGPPEEIDHFLSTIKPGSGNFPANWHLEVAARWLDSPRDYSAEARERMVAIVTAAKDLAADTTVAAPRRRLAIRAILAGSNAPADLLSVVAPLLGAQNSPEIQLLAFEKLAKIGSDEAAQPLLDAWPTLTPAIRSQAFDLVLGKAPWVNLLLERVASGTIPVADFDTLQRERLLKHADKEIRKAAASALAGGLDSNRTRIVDHYLETLVAGDPGHGRELFLRHCSACHRLEGKGFQVGPDLAALSSYNPRALVESILDPNRAVDERYRSYTLVNTNGLVMAGILTGETGTSLTMLENGGKLRTMLRADVEMLESTGKSLMPEGFERDLNPTDVCDLISYLTSAAIPPKTIAGNQPETAVPDADGTVWLTAGTAEIFGNEITFETPFQNIGYWHAANDYAAWTVKLPDNGEYQVYLSWACADDTAGDSFVIEAGGLTLSEQVAGTGGFDRYQLRTLGKLRLPAGESRIIVRPQGTKKQHALMDLYGLFLVPKGGNVDRVRLLGTPESDAAAQVARLTAGLAVGQPAEYERIPEIWQVAIEAGRRNQSHEILRVLELALPQQSERLEDWQSVVIGGGIINGLSQIGQSPKQRIEHLITDHRDLQERWRNVMPLATAMADNSSVKKGTRYDALRILGANSWENAGATLTKYLGEGIDPELQMGAVSGLVDLNTPEASTEIIRALAHLNDKNRQLAVQGLMRTEHGQRQLAAAVKSGEIQQSLLTAEELEGLSRGGRGGRSGQ